VLARRLKFNNTISIYFSISPAGNHSRIAFAPIYPGIGGFNSIFKAASAMVSFQVIELIPRLSEAAWWRRITGSGIVFLFNAFTEHYHCIDCYCSKNIKAEYLLEPLHVCSALNL
jgi:hypothetical protein